jgi:hypothetical protein
MRNTGIFMPDLCELKHTTHRLKKVDTVQGDMYVYDYEMYMGNSGYYCPGQDDVSMTLATTGQWEKDETTLVQRLLSDGDKEGIVLDFGAHVGWFTILAARLGYRVVAYEGDSENASTLLKNLKLKKLNDKVTIYNQWIDSRSLPLTINTEVELIKCDIEGNERYAINMCEHLIKSKKVNNILIEVSPVFNDSYPMIVNFIKSCGYKAYDLRNIDIEFNDIYDFGQTNLLFVRD